VQFLRKNINLSKVMHRQLANLSKVIYILVFKAFFTINFAYSDHLTAKITGFVDATSPIHILGYDRKYYFEENSAPLFIVVEQDINKFNKINLKAFPHIIIGVFAFQDTDGNGEFSKDFKGQPLEPFGFSLNPNVNFEDIVFENIAFDMSKFEQLEIKLK
tara:strand:+ start:158 stop:637 length:480 start_codon:yes stop_codon:yes gene_type:complete